MIATCPHLQKMMSSPVRALCIVNAVQQRHMRRGGSTANSTALTASLSSNSVQACACTPPTSNWFATIWQLQDNNTGNDVESAVFTDEEGSIGPDFQWAHVLSLDKFMNGLPLCLQTILMVAQCQLAWTPTTHPKQAQSRTSPQV